MAERANQDGADGPKRKRRGSVVQDSQIDLKMACFGMDRRLQRRGNVCSTNDGSGITSESDMDTGNAPDSVLAAELDTALCQASFVFKEVPLIIRREIVHSMRPRSFCAGEAIVSNDRICHDIIVAPCDGTTTTKVSSGAGAATAGGAVPTFNVYGAIAFVHAGAAEETVTSASDIIAWALSGDLFRSKVRVYNQQIDAVIATRAGSLPAEYQSSNVRDAYEIVHVDPGCSYILSATMVDAVVVAGDLSVFVEPIGDSDNIPVSIDGTSISKSDDETPTTEQSAAKANKKAGLTDTPNTEQATLRRGDSVWPQSSMTLNGVSGAALVIGTNVTVRLKGGDAGGVLALLQDTPASPSPPSSP